ncbi:MAG: ankyrin repeat domain-containing protein [Actinomycetota bacterium]|jgi:ankyrin repeat protein
MASSEDDLFALIAATDVRAVRGLLEDQPWLATDRDEDGVSALMRARYQMDRGLVAAVRAHVAELDVFESAAFGDLDRLSELLATEPDLVNATSGDGFTPLHLAAFFGQTDAVRLLLARGAEPDVRGQGWMTGTALSAAAAGGHTAIVLLLLEVGVDPNVQQAQGFTPLHAAAQNADLEAVRALLDAGADPAIVTEEGVTAAELAEQAGDLVTVETLRDALG